MFQRYFFHVLACAALVVSTGIIASAQVGQLRGHVVMKGADGKSAPVAGAIIDVFRTDVAGKFETKTNKKGEFIFAGLPFIGEYIVAASAPGAQPNYAPRIKAGRDVDYEILLVPDGDGRRLTFEEIKVHIASSGTARGDAKLSAEDAAKRDELIKKTKEIEESNKRNLNINEIVGRTFKAGNEALKIKNYDEAIKQYSEGLAADPEQGALYLQMSETLRQRGVERFNATIKSTDTDKTAGFDAAKKDFRQAVENAQKAVESTRKEETPTDAAGIAAQNTRRLNALIVRKEGMRLFVTKVDQTQAEAAMTAYNDYIAAQPDVALKQKARMELAQVLVDAGAADKGFAEYEKVLAEKPDDPEAIYGAGLALFATGNEAKYKEAANYLQRFVDKAPDGHKDKEAAMAVLAELKNTANVVPEKTAPTRRRRP